MSGYSYRLLQLRTCERWPRVRCWVCENIAEWGVRSVADERMLCREVSGLVMPDAHHLIPKRAIKRAGGRAQVIRTAGAELVPVADVLMDARNTVPVARFHHDALERRLLHGEPFEVPRGLLPPAVLEFVNEYDLGALLDAAFPREETE